MIYSYLLQINAWTAPVVHYILSARLSSRPGARSFARLSGRLPAQGRRVFGALALALALGSGLLGGSPALHAQETAPAGAMTTVNINTADAPALAAALKGVGESRAQEIVRYREAYGPFASAEELTEVKGIGQSTLDKNRKVITLE